jgi:hypothetical protein
LSEIGRDCDASISDLGTHPVPIFLVVSSTHFFFPHFFFGGEMHMVGFLFRAINNWYLTMRQEVIIEREVLIFGAVPA